MYPSMYMLTNVSPGLHRRWELTEHELIILLVVCITCTALAYMVGERLLLRTGLLAHAPVFSKDELAHTYDATVAQYDAWLSSAPHSHGWLTPLRSQVAAYVHATYLHLRARIAHALRRRTPTHSQRV